MDRLLWTPSPERVEGTQLAAFARVAGARSGRVLDSYAALHDWSVHEPAEF